MERKVVLKDIYLFDSNNNTLISDKQTSIDLSNFDKSIIKYTIDFFKEPQYISEFLKSVSNSKNHLAFVNTLIKYGMLCNKTKKSILQERICIVSYKKYNTHFSKVLDSIGLNNISFHNVDEDDKLYVSDDTTTILLIPNNPKLLIDILLNYESYNIKDLILGNIYLDEIWITYLKPNVTACPSCLGKRLYENLSTFKYAVDNNLYSEDETSTLIAIDFIAKSVKQLMSNVNDNFNPPMGGYLNIIDFSKLSIDKQLIVRMPNCNCLKKKVNSNDLVGDHVGLIRTIGQVQLAQSDPPVVLLTSNTKVHKSMDSGALDDNWNTCKIRAINEYLERYSWKNYNEDIITSNWTNLAKNKRIDINKFNIYSENQYLDKLIEFKKVDKNTVIDWILMKNTKNTKEKYIPAELVLGSKLQNCGNLTFRRSTGVAAGPSKEFTISKCILELIERDSITRSFLLKKDLFKLEVDILKNSNIYKKCLSYNLEPEIYLIENQYKVPVIMSRLVPLNKEDIVISYGYSSDTDLFLAIDKAIKESLLMRINIRDNIDKNGATVALGSSYYNLRNSKNSFFENLNIKVIYDLNLLENKISSTVNLFEIEDIYYKDITLDDVKCSNTYVITTWSPNMVDLVEHKNYAQLSILNCDIENLNVGYIPF